MSERLPWGKFVWSHWEGDEALSLCSLAAQGLWMRLLCIAAKERGYLRVSGKAPSIEKLARIVRSSPDEVKSLLDELEDEGVFSRTSDGTIYSRRMVRDAKNADKNRENGKKGGNPSLGKEKKNGEWVNHSDNPSDNPPVKAPLKADKIRRDKIREEEDSEPNGSGADAPLPMIEPIRPENPVDSRKAAWDLSLRLLMNRGMLPDHKARSIIGKWLKTFEPAAVRQAAQAAWDAKTLDPVAYVGAALPNIAAEHSNPMLRPDVFRQRIWMQDFVFNPGLWREHERGPRPGEPGCRVSAEIQAEYPQAVTA